MLIISLNGSPQKAGNTVVLLKEALKAAEQLGARVELIHVLDGLEDADVPYCNQCCDPCVGACAHNNKLGEQYDLMARADGIIVGSPVYFGTVSAQMKGFWDKTRFHRRTKAFLNVVGGAVSVGSTRFGGQETTVRALQDIMLVQGMTIVGDGFEEDDCGHQGACAQKPAAQDQIGLQRAAIMGRRVAQLAQATMALRKR
jgi:multimeric flavodoxin WrbA